ncbi:H-NS family nucleoid-associated regulatory protein [Stenotrophomonas mori]|uniref:H-NS histone family protein n=1 Tax=Stenotrophomonas mori TaxID=2871096 RepID=A0ABT0SKD7_9GAMM|nr:H-NS histone family protein [Stenotrophomonas mori]MCL7715793.1 H-NS histone family protein [Stenotrophomonas mori]
MSIDLTSLSLRELNTLIRAAQQRHTLLTRRTPVAQVRRALAAQAQRAGYTLAELFGADAEPSTAPPKARAKHPRSKVAPKYRDPDNRRNTWSGRGRMPRWLAAKTKHGRSAADFLIPGVARLTPKAPVPDGRRRLVKQG